MVDTPNTGFGRCKATHEVLVTIPLSIIMLGGAQEFITKFFNAVHISNRVGSTDDFVGINFPNFDAQKKGFERFGRSILLVGSEASLAAVLRKPGVVDIVNEFLLDDIFPHETVTGMGQVLLRERNTERHTKGDLERRMRRAERLGKPTEGYKKGLERLAEGKKPGRYKRGYSDLFLQTDKMKFSMRVVELQPTGTVEVSTYGISSMNNPLVCENYNVATKAD